MYSNTVYSSLLTAIPRSVFRQLVRKYQTDKHSKGFSSWDHLLAMVFAQLTGATSLREIEAGFNQHRFHHYHLGTREIRRSTLAAVLSWGEGHNLWISLGYNFVGFYDRDFSAAHYTVQEPYLRFRFKFDQDTLKALAQGWR